jgi:AbiV family abortive infection protein
LESSSNPAMDTLKQLVAKEPVLANAFRLFQDAAVLFEIQRWPSAVVLALLALEEIGKFLLTKWKASDASLAQLLNHHRSKQMAIGALFMTDAARKKFREEQRSINLSFSERDQLVQLMRAMIAGLQDGRGFGMAALNNVIEVMKWINLYYDEKHASKGMEPSKTTEQNAREVMGYGSRAFSLVADSGNVEIARIVFQILREQRQAKPAQR